MKKFRFLILTLCAVLFPFAFLGGCNADLPENSLSWNPPDYQAGRLVSLSAAQLFESAHETWEEENIKGYRRYLSFYCDLPIVGEQAIQEYVTLEMNGSDFVRVNAIKGGGSICSSKSGAGRFEKRGDNVYEGALSLSADEIDFTAAETLNIPLQENPRANTAVLTEFCLYARAWETLSAQHDDSVYLFEDAYYFCLTLRCVGAEGSHPEVEETIIKETGIEKNSFQWSEDTRIVCRVVFFDGKYYLTHAGVREVYEGKRIITIGGEQNTSFTYFYDDYAL